MVTPGQICEFGRPAADFALRGVDGKVWRLADVRGPKGTLVMFLANHCPYVKGGIARIAGVAEELRHHGVGTAAIMANDTAAYPEDGFENMQRFAAEHRFGFPYLIDESQAVARAYGAVRTPEFFGYDAGLRLQYHGRLDDSGLKAAPGGRRELLEAMLQIAAGQEGPREQHPSLGCSIKWKSA